MRLGDRIDAEDVELEPGERCASLAGVSLHANVSVPAHDRRRLERLCRYVARPPVATERLSCLADGRLLYRLKRRWRDGTTHVVFEPHELLERLVALIPPPRANQVRYHGVLAPAAHWRRAAICDRRPVREAPETTATQVASARRLGPLGTRGSRRLGRAAPDELPTGAYGLPAQTSAAAPADAGQACPLASASSPARSALQSTSVINPSSFPRARRLSWAELMQRVFARDVLCCPRCGGPMRIIAAIDQPGLVARILRSLRLEARPPPLAPPRPAEAPHPLPADDHVDQADFRDDGVDEPHPDLPD